MKVSQLAKAKDYKSSIKPIWCPGCGHYAVLASITRALAHLQADRDNTAILSGIGCSSRLPAYVDTYGFHGVHGRVLPLATGLKLSRPDLNVIAISGDGDAFSIGGNHFIHACRRNVNFLYIVMDNEVYGMTKGQASPTSQADWERGKMTPEGTQLNPLQPALLALSAGANWIGRAYSGNPTQMADLIVKGLKYPGFAFLHAITQCITYCPEQAEWKAAVHAENSDSISDRHAALARLLDDDGLTTGLLYESRPGLQTVKLQPAMAMAATAIATTRAAADYDLKVLGSQFEIS